MNYTTKNKEILKNMEEIFGDSPNSSIINITAEYSQGRKLSSVSLQIEGFPLYHRLILIYSSSIKLYDALKYKNKTVFRLGQLSQITPQIESINKFLLKNIPHTIPQASRKLNEDFENNDSQIEILKAENKMLKDKMKSYMEQMKFLRDKITLLNKRLRQSKNT